MNARRLVTALIATAVLSPGLAGVAAAGANGRDDRPPGRQRDGCPAIDHEELRAPYAFRSALTEEELATDFVNDETGLAASGYRPLRLTGYTDRGRVRYATRWAQVAGPPWWLSWNVTLDKLEETFAAFSGGFRITDISGFNTPDGVRYNAIWENNSAAVNWKTHFDVTADEMDELTAEYAAQGYVPERVEGYRGSDGELRMVATWISARKCRARSHSALSLKEYTTLVNDYAADGYRQVHLDATVVDGVMTYHAIWWIQDGPEWSVRVDRDWYLFQRLDNNYWCAGMPATNFYATDNGDSARFGGIWTMNTPNAIDDTSPVDQQVLEEVNCTPGRAGSAAVNLTTGESVMAHADEVFGTSSTFKSAILYALLRKVDEEGTSLQTLLDVNAPIGSNKGAALQEGNDETIEYLARTMIDDSNNWATNLLILYVGMDRINDELAAEPFGLAHTRLNRYMTGTDSPSAQGTSGARGDYEAGYDNVTTPREWTTFLATVHENPDGLLSDESYDKFWELLSLNGSDDDAVLDAGVGDGWPPPVKVAEKAGSNKWGWDDDVTPWATTKVVGDYAHRPQLGPHLQRSEGGRLELADGDVVVYASFINEADNPSDSYTPFDNTLDCILVEVARAYGGQTTGAVLPQCQ
ncbi:MAG: serine hydrolase [Ilumatobacteraceae bacterium]